MKAELAFDGTGEIWECEYSPSAETCLHSSCNFRDISDCPKGTVLADKVKLTMRVYPAKETKMFKIIEPESSEIGTKKMCDMEPCELAVIVANGSINHGHQVMRTASICHFEVMDLSNPGEDSCWTDDNQPTMVRPLLKGEKVTLVVE